MSEIPKMIKEVEKNLHDAQTALYHLARAFIGDGKDETAMVEFCQDVQRMRDLFKEKVSDKPRK